MTATQDLPLFAGEPAAERLPFFDALSAAARIKLGAPENWEWYEAKSLQPTDDTMITGGVPNGGNRNARWKGVAGQMCVVTRAEIEAANAVFERETGRCSRCSGNGTTLASASVTQGHTYRPCDQCEGTGQAREGQRRHG